MQRRRHFCFSLSPSTWEKSSYKRAARIPEVTRVRGEEAPGSGSGFPARPPTARAGELGLQLLTPRAHLEKRGRPRPLRQPGRPPSYPQERRKALSVVSNGKVLRLRPHGFNDVLIKRGSFFLENKTRHSTGRLQGHSCVGGDALTTGLVVSRVTE